MKVEVIKRSHSGIQAMINNEDMCLVGNEDFLNLHNIELPYKPDIKNPDAQQIVYLVINKEIIGHVEIKDPVRERAQFVIDELKNRNINVHLCTGASKNTAEKYATELGIPLKNVCSNVEKLRDLVMVSISKDEEVNHEQMEELSNEHDNKPILINHDGQISMYGYSEDQWKITPLNKAAFKSIKISRCR